MVSSGTVSWLTPKNVHASVHVLLVLLLALLPSGAAFGIVPTMSAGSSSTGTPKHTLYDLPVSNNGARCRIVLYKKGIAPEEVDVVSPMELGGLKDPAFLRLNPQGKMPLLVVHGDDGDGDDVCVPESDTICRYLVSRYGNDGPSFRPDDVRSNLVARLHDMYLTTIQGCLYKAVPPFGVYGCRSEALAEFRHQLGVIADNVPGNDVATPYLFGDEVTLADATLFPTAVFATFMLPKFGVPAEEALPPKLARWYDAVVQQDDDFAKVHQELVTSLEKWDEGGRWDGIYLAGNRDDAPATLFDKIIAGEIPADVVREDDKVLAFRDINPAAPGHVLVIPKERMGLTQLTQATKEHEEILGRLMVTAADIARDESLGFGGDGARIVVNDGKGGCQEIYHLHVHVLGGRQLTWPPG